MKKLVKAASLFFALGFMTLFSGCDDQASVGVVIETDEPMYRRAKDLIDRGKKAEALENFLKLILKRDDNAPESHLEVGRIYLYHIKDPISAIYHFKRYKSLQQRNPRGPNASQKLDLVDELVQTAMKDFAASFDAEVFQYPLERLTFVDTIEKLQGENEALKLDLEKVRRQVRSLGHNPPASFGSGLANNETPPARQNTNRSPVEVARIQPTRPAPLTTQNVPTNSGQRYYTIKTGDTLYKISSQVYGDGSRWQEILRANRTVIPDSSALQIGARLVIP